MKYIKIFEAFELSNVKSGENVDPSDETLLTLKDLTTDISDMGFIVAVKGYGSYGQPGHVTYDIIIRSNNRTQKSEVFDLDDKSYRSEISKFDNAIASFNKLVDSTKELVDRIHSLEIYICSYEVTYSESLPYSFIRMLAKEDGTKLDGDYRYKEEDESDELPTPRRPAP